MRIPVQRREPRFATVIVPNTSRVVYVAIPEPGPIAQNDFCGWLHRHATAFYRRRHVPCRLRIATHMLHLVTLDRPSHEIAIPPGIPAGAGDRRVKRITAVGRAMTRLQGYVPIEGPIGFPNKTSVKSIRSPFATPRRPIAIRRRRIPVVIDIHRQSDADLPLVIIALRAISLRLRSGQSRQKYRGQNGDNRNHHQQLDQSECTTTYRRTASANSSRVHAFEALYHTQSRLTNLLQTFHPFLTTAPVLHERFFS